MVSTHAQPVGFSNTEGTEHFLNGFTEGPEDTGLLFVFQRHGGCGVAERKKNPHVNLLTMPLYLGYDEPGFMDMMALLEWHQPNIIKEIVHGLCVKTDTKRLHNIKVMIKIFK